MKNNTELIHICCPSCSNPLVSTYKDRDVEGDLVHKCSQCKRFWNVDYTNKYVIWVENKENETPIKEFRLESCIRTLSSIRKQNNIKLY